MSVFPKKIEDKFTDNLKETLNAAEDLAQSFGHREMALEHLLFSLITREGSVSASATHKEKFDIQQLQERIEHLPKSHDANKRAGAMKKRVASQTSFSLEVKAALQEMVLCASTFDHSYIGTEHLLFALLKVGGARIDEILTEMGMDGQRLRTQLNVILESSHRFSDVMRVAQGEQKNPTGGILGMLGINLPGFNPGDLGSANSNPMMSMPTSGKNQSALETFCVHMNAEEEDKRYDTIVGREMEIAKVMNILSRKTKSNPVLVGEPGVGKTAIVQGLVQKILAGEVPSNLAGKQIYALDLGLLIAGTVFRGEFESRLKDVITEVVENPEVILFIDEIHTIIGAGNTGGSGSLDAANILKPPLSRGEISCIGATTVDEYRKHFQKDAALDRRFQMVLVEEPSAEEAEKMLLGVKNFYEEHHNLVIEKAAIVGAVTLSQRFINDRFLPDKALDVIDEAAALVRARHGSKNYYKEIKALEKKQTQLDEQKEKMIAAGDFENALLLKLEADELEREIIRLKKKQSKENAAKIKVPVGMREVEEVVEQMTGVPVGELLSEERNRLKDLEKEIKRFIVGQDEAVGALAAAIRHRRSGIAGGNRPIGVFMFLGPTGVGKTELVKVLAERVYRSKQALIKVDMSEFMERHNVSRLVGAPAGYVGYEEGGKLTEAVRLHPYSVVLFDEIEKAHPDVFNLMLQIFEDGELTDAAGRKVDFRNTIIVMTSNLGTDELTEEASVGFATETAEHAKAHKDKLRARYLEAKEDLVASLKDEFRPEFLNRIDRVLVFNPLSRKDIAQIVEIHLKDLVKRVWEKKRIKLTVNKAAKEFLVEESFDPGEGARSVRHNLERLVEDRLAAKIVQGELEEGGKARVILEKEKLTVK